MHQTTCGETHKTEIFERKEVLKFLEEEKEFFANISSKNVCMYQNTKTIDSSCLNYLNTFSTTDLYTPKNQLKSILRKEFDNCDKVYPYLGEIFLNLFFDNTVLDSKKKYFFDKASHKIFLNTVPEINSKKIGTWIIDNSSTDRVVYVKESYVEEINLVVNNDMNFNINFDRSFLGGKKDLFVKDYRFAIIDGFIESIGEIHHMLHFAASSKEPHILFCFGMSEEVKRVIIENNKRKITQIIPISMTIDEDTVNILNDIAVLHNSDIISCLKGQTISQEMRNELKIGKSITFTEKGFKIEPLCNKEQIRSHVNFLNKRIDEALPDTNTDLIKNRIQNLRSKSLEIFVPKILSKSIEFGRSMDYFLRMVNFSNSVFYKIKLDNREIMIPVSVYNHAHKKVNKTKEMIYNIEKILIKKE